MDFKFNGGKGALLCSQCRKIIEQDFPEWEWKALMELMYTENSWFCKECCPISYKEQSQKLVEACNRIAKEYAKSVHIKHDRIFDES